MISTHTFVEYILKPTCYVQVGFFVAVEISTALCCVKQDAENCAYKDQNNR